MDKNVKFPLVTVSMVVFNGELHIREAIESILNQSFTDLELLIINDGSTDATLDIINQFKDPRIRLLSNDGNKGVAFTRNRSLQEARGVYFAILDSDDIAKPNRLEIQVNFMNAHPETAICGAQAIIIDSAGKQSGNLKVREGFQDMSAQLVLQNIFINSTLMMKTAVLREVGGYRENAPSEDYDLSFRVSIKRQVVNLSNILVAYRIHDHNISLSQREKLTLAEYNVIRSIHASLHIQPDEHLVTVHHNLMYFRFHSNKVQEFLQLLQALKLGNSRVSNYPENSFNKMLFDMWFIILKERKEKKSISLFFRNDLIQRSFISFKYLRKIFKLSFFAYLRPGKK